MKEINRVNAEKSLFIQIETSRKALMQSLSCQQKSLRQKRLVSHTMQHHPFMSRLIIFCFTLWFFIFVWKLFFVLLFRFNLSAQFPLEQSTWKGRWNIKSLSLFMVFHLWLFCECNILINIWYHLIAGMESCDFNSQLNREFSEKQKS